MNSDSIWAIRCVWMRYFDVFRKDLLYGLVATFAEPILYLTSFGYGMGAIVGSVSEQGTHLSYRQFVFAGIVAQTLLFQSFFEAAYGSFVRMYYQKIFKAMATTPVTIGEVLWGELIWDASKSTFSASVVLLIGVITGDFSPWGALLTIPFAFLAAFLFAGFGLWMSSMSQSIEQISYPNYLFVFPMFLFCGVYFPLEKLPAIAQYVAALLPLTWVVSVVRSLTLGLPFHWEGVPILIAWLIFFVWVSRRGMSRRIIQ